MAIHILYADKISNTHLYTFYSWQEAIRLLKNLQYSPKHLFIKQHPTHTLITVCA